MWRNALDLYGNTIRQVRHVDMRICSCRPQTFSWRLPARLRPSNWHDLWPALLFYFSLSFLFELPELALLQQSRDNEYTATEYGVVGGLSALPWVLKPVWGWMVDQYSLPLIAWCTACYAVYFGAFYVLTLNISIEVFATAATAVSWSLCFMDVIVDCVTVTYVRDCETQTDSGTFQTRIWQLRAVGGLSASLLGGLLTSEVGPEMVLWLCAGLFVLPMAALCRSAKFTELYATKQMCGDCSTNRPGRSMLSGVCTPDLRGMVLFSFLIAATPSIGGYLSYYVLEQGVTVLQLTIVDVVDYTARLMGATIWHKYLREVSYRKLFGWCTVLIVFLKAANFVLVSDWLSANWHYALVAGADGAALCLASQVLVLPIMNYVAKSCQAGHEGRTYALAISISNLGGAMSVLLGTAIGGSLHVGSGGDYSSMTALIAITAALALAPLLALQLVPQNINGKTRTQCQTQMGASHVVPCADSPSDGIELNACSVNPSSDSAISSPTRVTIDSVHEQYKL